MIYFIYIFVLYYKKSQKDILCRLFVKNGCRFNLQIHTHVFIILMVLVLWIVQVKDKQGRIRGLFLAMSGIYYHW